MSTARALGRMLFPIFMLFPGLAPAQDYPSKPIRILAPSVGGSGDFVARVIAQGMIGGLGQPVFVENRTGLVVRETMANAPPDGYTLSIQGSALWLDPLLQKVSYDPVKDYSPIAMLVTAPMILVVHPSLPVKTVKELITLAKAKPGALNYATGGGGSATHLGGELFRSMAGVDIVRVNYKGADQATRGLSTGEVELMISNSVVASPHVKAGRLKALAVASAAPTPLAPNLPTIAATLPGYEYGIGTASFAPKGTPVAIVSRVNREMVRILNLPEVKDRFFNIGVQSVGSSPKELASAMESEMTRMGKVIKEAEIRAE